MAARMKQSGKPHPSREILLNMPPEAAPCLPCAWRSGLPMTTLRFTSFDPQFVWYFAPGSEMSIVWKNAINTHDDQLVHSYFTDLGNTINAPQSNRFSIRVLYYLDYLYVKKAFSKKQPPDNK